MNRRTKEISQELSLQAERWCYDNLAGPTPAEWNDKFHQKFAELIVKECVSKALQGQLTNMNGNQIAYIIKEHFGVK